MRWAGFVALVFALLVGLAEGQSVITGPPSNILKATSASLGGGALTAGTCATNTTTVTGAANTMVALADPQTDPGAAFYWGAVVTSADTVTTKVCAAVAGTPTATVYNIRVIP